MKEYDFTLRFRLANPDDDAESYLDSLAMSGCDDAVVGIGKHGQISLDFIREADSALEAIGSAIKDVKKAIPQARLVEAAPDFVGMTDLANLYGFSRQYVRKLIQDNSGSFPVPMHDGKPSLWHLIEVCTWFQQNEKARTPLQDNLIEVARVNMQLNLCRSYAKEPESLREELKELVT